MAKKEVKYGRCENPECPNFGMPVEATEDGKCPDCGRELVFDSGNGPSTGGDPDDPFGVIPTGTEGGGNKKKIILAVVAAIVIIAAIVAVVLLIMNNKQEKKSEETLTEINEKEAENARQDSIEKANKMKGYTEYVNSKVESLDPSVRNYIDSVLSEELAMMEKEYDAKALANDSMQKARIDSIVEARVAERMAQDAKAKPQEKAKSKSASGGSLDYGRWTGRWSKGKPSGTGTMYYKKEHLIDSRDPQKRVAQKGDYIIGEFYDGKLVQGKWYDSSNTVKGSIIIGR